MDDELDSEQFEHQDDQRDGWHCDKKKPFFPEKICDDFDEPFHNF